MMSKILFIWKQYKRKYLNIFPSLSILDLDLATSRSLSPYEPIRYQADGPHPNMRSHWRIPSPENGLRWPKRDGASILLIELS